MSFKLSSAIWLLFPALACNPRRFHEEGANAQHAWNSVANTQLASSPYRNRYWTDVSRLMDSDQTFRQELTQGLPMLPSDHPMVARLQRHADSAHAGLVASGGLPRDFPPPRVYILQTDNPVARTEATARCIQGDFGPDAPPNTVTQVDFAAISANSPLMSTIWNSERKIPCEPGSQEDLRWLISHIPPDPLRSCEYFVKNGVLTGNLNCFKRRSTTPDGNTVVKEATDLWKSSTISWYTTTNAIFFSSGFVKARGREEEMVAVLFHELAHYYRNHSSTLINNQPFLFQSGPGLRRGRPTPIPAQELSNEIRAAHQLFNAVDIHSVNFEPVPGVDYQLPLWRFVAQVVLRDGAPFSLSAQCGQADCPPACSRILTQRQNAAFRGLLESLEFYARGNRNVTQSVLARYPEVEPQLKQCFSALPATSPVGSVLRSLGSFDWTPGNVATFHEQLLNYQQFVELLLAERRKAWDVLLRSGIRHYSTETEADEMGVELLHRAGLDPRHAVNANLALTGTQAYAGLGRVGFQQCHAMARQNFRNPDGTWMAMLPVNTQDEHYQACYRAQVAAQEIEAHPEYKQGSYRTLPAAEWAELRKALP